VCTRVGGMHELVDSGIDGILVPSRDPAALTAALFDLLHAPERAAQLGARARLKVESRFDHRIGAQALVRCLTETGVAS
jgi:colanic acid/amylovoran biosynthesis glycosyltransferase